MRPSFLYNGNSFTAKTASLYWNGSGVTPGAGGDPKRSKEKWNLGPKRLNSVRICSFITPKIVLVLVDEKKYPQKIKFNPQNVKKGGQNGGTSISPNIEGVPHQGVTSLEMDPNAVEPHILYRDQLQKVFNTGWSLVEVKSNTFYLTYEKNTLILPFPMK